MHSQKYVRTLLVYTIIQLRTDFVGARCARPCEMNVTLFLKRRECVGFPETSEVEFWGFRVCPHPTTRIIYPVVSTNFTATLKPSKFLKLQSVGLEFRSFESTITSVVLARKDGIVLSKPIKHPCFIENLRKISAHPK